MGIRPRDPTVLVSSPAQPPQPLRVPPCGASTLESMRLWSALLLSLLQHSTPIFMLRPVDGQWMDVIVGDPTASQLYCLRASPEAVPFTTEIPYTLDPKFVERAGRFIGLDDVTIASLSATTNGAVAASAPSPASA
jgi:hypothetical protein